MMLNDTALRWTGLADRRRLCRESGLECSGLPASRYVCFNK
jgi:hypothetical protein